MDKAKVAKSIKFGDKSTSDITIRLRNKEGRSEVFHTHSFILKSKSKVLAEKLSRPNYTNCIEIHCSDSDYDHHVDLLRRLYLPSDLLLDSWVCVKSTLGVLQVSAAFHCEEITRSCIEYLEAVPWEDKEEEEILKAVSNLGPLAMPILARIQPVDLRTTKNVFVSAIRFATSIEGPYPPLGNELKTSAQEQVEYMLGEDEDTPLVTADEEVKMEVRKGLLNIFSSFETDLSSLLLDSNLISETSENNIMQSLSDIEWMCNMLPKMDLMTDFVGNWVEISGKILGVVEDKKIDSLMWGFKVKLIEITGKVLEAVGYGNVIIPTLSRVQLIKTWLPYIRKIKPLLDSMNKTDSGFPHKMNEELCQSIEGAIVSFILALPSNDQADILGEWLKGEQVLYPDLSEAFEIWCYRTKSAKRRLVEGLERVDNATLSL